MYDRAARSLNLVVGCTPDHVGPGTYEQRRKRMTEESYAPFLSLSNRGDIFLNDENPGPGYYDLRTDRSSTIKGGCTLANRASRFDHKLLDNTPGPGTYDFQSSQSARSAANDVAKHPRQNIFKYNRKWLPPSIPDPKLAFGFEEDEAGKLIPQLPPNRDDSLGPAFYNASVPTENDPSKLYHGVHFSKYSGKRTDFAGKSGPGPGAYDPSDHVKVEVHHMNIKPYERRSELQIPRYPENVLKRVAKDGVPGPGQYSIKREMDPVLSKSEITGIEYERPGFGSQTNRFDTRPSEVPGPASYNDQVLTAFNTSQTKTTSFKQTPFNQTTARFPSPDYKSKREPSPGQYRISSFTDENLRRAVIEGGRRPPFNVASVRRLNIIHKDEYETPGPSSYEIKSQSFKSKTDQPSANFICNTAREPILEDSPGPTAYDVPRAYQALTSQHRQSPRSKNARKRHSQFLSAAARIYAGDTSIDTPGPGAYDGFLTTRPHGYAPVYDARFRPGVSNLPGPAEYELSPLFQDTVLRGTFNSTLNNPILAKMQSRAIREEKAAANAAAPTAVQGLVGNRNDSNQTALASK